MLKNKILKSILALAIIFGLVACNNNNEKESNTLTVWAWNVNVPVLEEVAEKYKSIHEDFELEVIEMANDDVYNKVTVELQAGGDELPDLLLIEDDRIPGFLYNYEEHFVNLNDYNFVEDHAEKFPEFKIDTGSRNGNHYAIPFDVGPVAMFYREDLFQKAGINIEDIVTWEDYNEAGKILQEKLDVSLIPIQEHTHDLYVRLILNQQGKSYFDADGEVDVNNKITKEALTIVKELSDSGSSLNVVDGGERLSALVNSESASVIMGSWFTGMLMGQGPDLSGKWRVAPMPSLKEGEVRAANAGGSSFLIPKSSANVDLAYDFLTFFATDLENQKIAQEVGGMFPSLLEIYTESDTPDNIKEFFGGQEVWELLGKVIEKTPKVPSSPHMSEALAEMKDVQSDVINGEDIDKRLDLAEKNIQNSID